MTSIKRFIGMAYATAAVRTAVQVGLAVVVASGTGFVDVAVWKTAGLAAGAALLAKLQSSARG
jgi:hypothetical protein